MQIKFLIFLLLILIFPFDRYSDEVQVGQAIQWKAIPGAYGYIVEIVDSSENQVLKKSISNSELELNLPEGNYKFRVLALNKFKKIGKVYPWKELIIKPVDSPVVTSSPKYFDTSDKKSSFIAKGKFLHRGTRVELEKSRNEVYNADVVVLKDGSGIKVIPPEDLPEGNYSVRYKNTKGKPFVNSVAVVSQAPLTSPSDLDKSKQIVDGSPKDKSVSSGDKLQDGKKSRDSVTDGEAIVKDYTTWSLFWRQAVIPGWGHYHAGYKKTGAFYFFGTIVAAGAVAHTSQAYSSRRKSYNEQGNIANYLNSQPDLDPNIGIYNQLNIQSGFQSAEVSKIQASNSIAALGGFYIINLIHILITGANLNDSSNVFLLESTPEFWQNEVGTKYRAGVKLEF
ncbi:MAG: hypothetical protein JJT78_18570 [Leptospira sp.]|nr:hypothetical protein [Leptospira sp.]